ncbi:MAG: zinc-binding dehydrogenase [Rhodospirillaceae bacterium]|nr:zinc-binding dehydrogenase [Rhodospirillaceae bacterium]
MSPVMFPRTYRKFVLERFGEDFRACTRIVETPWQDPGDGEMVVRNVLAGVNGVYDYNMMRNAVAYMTFTTPTDMGIEVVGRVAAVGRGVTGFKEGDAVATWKVGTGYRDYQVAEAGRLHKIDAPTAEMLTLFPTGVSGLIGLTRAGELSTGEVVAVSAAAGGLGHIVVQVAKLAGNHVIGIAGGAEKCALLRTIGCDRSIDYRTEDVAEALKREYPAGVNLAYDSVGGTIYDALVDNLAVRGRLVISGYTSEVGKPLQTVTQGRAWTKLYFKSASIRGFINPHYQEFWPEAAARLLDLYDKNQIRVFVDPRRFEGLEAVPEAVDYLLSGRNIGKIVVRLAPGA